MLEGHTSKSRNFVERIWDWVANHRYLRFLTETNILAALLLMVIAMYGFMELADEVMDKETQHLDEMIVTLFRNPADMHEAIGPWWLTPAALDITALGGTTVLILVVLITLGFLWLAKKRRILFLVAAAAIGGQIFNSVLKHAFMRPRPSVVPHLTEVQTSSFPSGHSMMSAVIYLTLGVLISRLMVRPVMRFYIMAVACTLTVLVGFSRVFLGVHYPTDVVAGWAAGLAWALLCLLVARILQNRGTVERPGEETDRMSEGPHEAAH